MLKKSYIKDSLTLIGKRLPIAQIDTITVESDSIEVRISILNTKDDEGNLLLVAYNGSMKEFTFDSLSDVDNVIRTTIDMDSVLNTEPAIKYFGKTDEIETNAYTHEFTMSMTTDGNANFISTGNTVTIVAFTRLDSLSKIDEKYLISNFCYEPLKEGGQFLTEFERYVDDEDGLMIRFKILQVFILRAMKVVWTTRLSKKQPMRLLQIFLI